MKQPSNRNQLPTRTYEDAGTPDLLTRPYFLETRLISKQKFGKSSAGSPRAIS